MRTDIAGGRYNVTAIRFKYRFIKYRLMSARLFPTRKAIMKISLTCSTVILAALMLALVSIRYFLSVTYIPVGYETWPAFPEKEAFSKESMRNNQSTEEQKTIGQDPWMNIPTFQIFIRMNSGERYVHEYSTWFVRGFRQNYPSSRATNSLVIGFDKEKKQDHQVGEQLGRSWPFPKICYMSPITDDSVYTLQRYRSFWDQFYPEKCVTTEYVGYADSDTMFSSLVTPNSLFENGKPIIIGRVGLPPFPHWPLGTEYVIGHKEAFGCMSYFPVLIKVSHIKNMRRYVSKRFQKPFDQVFRQAYGRFGFDSPSQFCIICNYLWYYHRNEYSFRLQLTPDNSYDGKLHFSSGMAPLDFIQNEMRNLDHTWIPKPRTAVHARYLSTPRKNFIYGDVRLPEAVKELKAILKESFCYIRGFDLCSDFCKEFNRTKVSHYLFQFEGMSWHWDKRCFEEQQKYLEEAKLVAKFYEENNQSLFGLNSTTDICVNMRLSIEG